MPVLDPTLAHIAPPTKSCHNCRRRRLRCDRSLPACEKCHANGDTCLGYGKLIRWANVGAVTVRGKIHGPGPSHRLTRNSVGKLDPVLTVYAEDAVHAVGTGPIFPAIQFSLIDPLLQDLAPRNRLYINHCEFEALIYSSPVW